MSNILSDLQSFGAAELTKAKAVLMSAANGLAAFIKVANGDAQAELPKLEADAIAQALDVIPEPMRDVVSSFVNQLATNFEGTANAKADAALNTIVAAGIARLMAAAQALDSLAA